MYWLLVSLFQCEAFVDVYVCLMHYFDVNAAVIFLFSAPFEKSHTRVNLKTDVVPDIYARTRWEQFKLLLWYVTHVSNTC